MIRDILRFNREAPRLLDSRGRFAAARRLPGRRRATRRSSSSTTSCRWAPPSGAPARATLRDFPARYFVRFFHNHGMLSRRRPAAVAHGARRLGALRREPHAPLPRPHPSAHAGRSACGARRRACSSSPRAREAERFDRVFFACHSDQALRCLPMPRPSNARCSAPSATSATRCCCTPIRACCRERRLAWAAWNYHVCRPRTERVAVTYQHEHPAAPRRRRTPLLRHAEPVRSHRPTPRDPRA